MFRKLTCGKVEVVERALVGGEEREGKSGDTVMIPELPFSVKSAVAKACCCLGSKHLGFCHVWLPSQLRILPRGSPPAAVRQNTQFSELLSILSLHLLVVKVEKAAVVLVQAFTDERNC